MTVLIFGAGAGLHDRMLLEEAECEENEVVEIHSVAGVEGGFVAFADVFGQGADAFIGEDCRAFAAVFVTAQQAKNGGGVGLFALGRDLREDLFSRWHRFVRIRRR